MLILINIGFYALTKIKYFPIDSYIEEIRKLKAERKKGRKMNNDINNSTLIGYKGNSAVYIPDNSKHIFICGTTGSGKTIVLSNFINRVFNMNYPALIVDGKGDIGEGSILDITENFKRNYDKKVYVIDLNNPKTSDKYNPFNNANPTVAKDMLINLSSWSEEHYKVNTERYLQKVITLMQLQNIPLSFESIVKYMGAENFIDLSMNLRKTEIISKDEHLNNVNLTKISGAIAEAAAARFSLLLESELGTIFHKDGIDITTALKEKAVIVFVLNPLLYPETSALMGRLILIDSKKAISNLFEFDNKSGRSFFILDEINSFASSVLIDLVNKSRSAGVTCILATQSLSDLDCAVDENFKEQIIENCNNYIVLRQNRDRKSTRLNSSH